MKAKEIRDLIDFISNSGLDEVNIETQEFKISVKKNSPAVIPAAEAPQPVMPQQVVADASVQPAAIQQASTPAQEEKEEESSRFVEIKSPMIGTFYASPSPDTDPFVKEGDTVTVGQTVCIIEAMKLFNEIESEYSGKIVKVLVENASPVEYDQPLFLVDPS